MKPRLRRRGALATTGVVAVALAGAVAALAVDQPGPEDLTAQIDRSRPRNVILLIGDGFDDSMQTAARNYLRGAGGRFEMDALPFVGDVTTYGLKVGPGPDYEIAYVPDSALTASAWSTGRKTVEGRVSQGPSTDETVPGEDYRTVMMEMRDRGKRTGNVSTSEVTDATPAAAAANINARSCQGPRDMRLCPRARKRNGGKGSIAEQLVDNEVDVILGGGRDPFLQATDAGPRVLDHARDAAGYRYVADKRGLDHVGSLSGGRVLGLFAPASMTPRFSPLVAAPPPGSGGADARCAHADRGAQPSLAAMTRKAIGLLDDPKGFFLQVESGSIDTQEHEADICGAIGEVAELDDAVAVALDYQRSHPDTLVVVTADHAHSTQIVEDVDGGRQTATLRTADGDPMHVAYSTDTEGSSHTGATVRVAAKGPRAASVNGLIDQTELYPTLLGVRAARAAP